MNEFWKFKFDDNLEFIETYDELPLWSASFGLFLLKNIKIKPYTSILDIGSGAGFPLFEIAERIGNNCICYGIDTWKNANIRSSRKIKNYNVSNVRIIETSAEEIPLENESIELIVSNLGINNFINPNLVLKESYRILKPNCNLVLTTNLNGHWKEFYNIFEETLKQLKRDDLILKIQKEQEHRGSIESISQLFIENGFKITRHFEEKFEMRFLNGSSFLNHHFIKMGWLSSWLELIPKSEHENIFNLLELNLNNFAEKKGELSLTVPMAFIEGQKI